MPIFFKCLLNEFNGYKGCFLLQTFKYFYIKAPAGQNSSSAFLLGSTGQ